jgi:dTDP-glucose pyrophosphorylase
MFVIPMVGKSSRFYNAGYKKPKYMLELNGRSVFSHSILSFEKYFKTDEFLFIVKKHYDTPSFVEEEIQRLGIRHSKIKIIDRDTEGQAETVYIGLNGVLDATPIFIFNIDTFRHTYSKPDFIKQCDGYLEVFKGDGENWSFIEPGENQRVAKTTEKERISDLCSDGLYYFRKKLFFDEVFSRAWENKKTTKGEYFIAPLYNDMIKNGADVRYQLVTKEQIIFCGTPEEFEKIKANESRLFNNL